MARKTPLLKSPESQCSCRCDEYGCTCMQQCTHCVRYCCGETVAHATVSRNIRRPYPLTQYRGWGGGGRGALPSHPISGGTTLSPSIGWLYRLTQYRVALPSHPISGGSTLSPNLGWHYPLTQYRVALPSHPIPGGSTLSPNLGWHYPLTQYRVALPSHPTSGGSTLSPSIGWLYRLTQYRVALPSHPTPDDPQGLS